MSNMKSHESEISNSKWQTLLIGGGVLILAMLRPSAAAEPASRPAIPNLVPEPPIAVYRDPARYDTFPDVKRLPGGKILCVFRDASYPKPIRHIEADARVVGVTSADDGRHWSEPVVIHDAKFCENDPSVAVLRDGRLLLTFFAWEGITTEYAARHPSPESRRVDRGEWGEYARLAGVHLLRGSGNPVTWEKRAEQMGGPELRVRAISSSILETKSGTLLMPIYGPAPKKEPDLAYVLRSTDGGRTWSREVLMAGSPDGKVGMQEPALGQARDGTIVTLMRTENAGDHLYTATSPDDGATWTPARETPLIGHPADLISLPDGRLLAVYGYRHDPLGVRACVSEDGKSWDRDREIVIAANGDHGDLGYPSACLTNDGHVLIVYYMNGPGTPDRWIECKRIPLARFR